MVHDSAYWKKKIEMAGGKSDTKERFIKSTFEYGKIIDAVTVQFSEEISDKYAEKFQITGINGDATDKKLLTNGTVQKCEGFRKLLKKDGWSTREIDTFSMPCAAGIIIISHFNAVLKSKGGKNVSRD
jgi:hypothetical protein